MDVWMGLVMLVLLAWQVNMDSKWFLLRDGILSSLLVPDWRCYRRIQLN